MIWDYKDLPFVNGYSELSRFHYTLSPFNPHNNPTRNILLFLLYREAKCLVYIHIADKREEQEFKPWSVWQVMSPFQ